jgi:hypothetical protein
VAKLPHRRGRGKGAQSDELLFEVLDPESDLEDLSDDLLGEESDAVFTELAPLESVT